jgi:hypothetical protein
MVFYEVVFYQTPPSGVFLAPNEYKFGSLDMLKYSNAHKIKDMDTFAKQHPVVVVCWLDWRGRFENCPNPNWKKSKKFTINDY